MLSNLGLSYALSRNLDLAEQTLRLAADQPGADARVRANLAMVLGLKGRFADAETGPAPRHEPRGGGHERRFPAQARGPAESVQGAVRRGCPRAGVTRALGSRGLVAPRSVTGSHPVAPGSPSASRTGDTP